MIKIYFLKIKNARKYSKEFTKDILSKELNVNREELYISNDNYGKPYLKYIKNFNFNISHSNNMIICGVSNAQIGVDIEKVRHVNQKIVDRFFTQREKDYIYANNSEQNERFIEIWTKKEAYVKWIGKGIEIPFKSFDVTNDTRIKTLYIEKYILSICSNTTISNARLELIDVNNLLDKYK